MINTSIAAADMPGRRSLEVWEFGSTWSLGEFGVPEFDNSQELEESFSYHEIRLISLSFRGDTGRRSIRGRSRPSPTFLTRISNRELLGS